MPARWRLIIVTGLWANTGTLTLLGATVMLPALAEDFGVSTATAAWVASLFPLTLAATFVPGSQLGNLFGYRRVSQVASYLEVGILIATFFMPFFAGLIALRLVSGLARGIAVPNNQAFVMAMFNQAERGKAVGVHTAMIGIGMLIATPLVGFLVEGPGWRWVFMLSALIYLALDLIISFGFPEKHQPRPEGGAREFDFGGAALFMLTIASFLIGVQLAGRGAQQAWPYLLIAGAIAFGVIFVTYEKGRRQPVLPVRLFKLRSVSVPLWHNLLFMFMNGVLLFLLPVFYIEGLGWSAAYAGSVLIAWNIGRPFGSLASGFLADRVGTAPVAVVSSLSFGGTLLGIGLFGGTGSLPWIVPILVLMGLTHSVFGTANMKSLYGSVPREQLALVPGTMGVGRHIGTSAGIGIASTVFAALIGAQLDAETAAGAMRTIMVAAAGFFFLGMAVAWAAPAWWRAFGGGAAGSAARAGQRPAPPQEEGGES